MAQKWVFEGGTQIRGMDPEPEDQDSPKKATVWQ